jgi:hypothetical protein
MVRRVKPIWMEALMRSGSEEQKAVVARSRTPGVGDLIIAYLSDLAAQGYKAKTIDAYRGNLLRFADHALRRRYRLKDLEGQIGPFIEGTGSRGHGPEGWRCVLRRFIGWLRGRGLVPQMQQPSRLPHGADLVEQYVRFQSEHRGVLAEQARRSRRVCTAFLASLRAKKRSTIRLIRPESIHKFVAAQGRRCSRVTLSGWCYALRGSLRFLYRRRAVARDFSPRVLVPRIFQEEGNQGCP